MPPEPLRPLVEEYVAFAERDLRAATVLSRESDLANAVCFHSQQAVEKMLKAVLLAVGVEPPRTHDLVFLLETLERSGSAPDGLEDVCTALADFGVAPRYPGWEVEAGEVDSADALRKAMIGVEMLRPLTRERSQT